MLSRLLLGLTLLASTASPALAQAIASEMTCEQAIAHYEANGVILVFANDRFAVPVRGGVPISQATTLQCQDRSQTPRPFYVRTRDAWRCVLGVKC